MTVKFCLGDFRYEAELPEGATSAEVWIGGAPATLTLSLCPDGRWLAEVKHEVSLRGAPRANLIETLTAEEAEAASAWRQAQIAERRKT